ncbi:superoxide dismutase family protein [Oceaniglobus roseus]|uniref:superoxide dismutase family protein n=1 Tax=Oceaniglobus roseus TaxID=1737570 RepID=UPI001562E5E1|nr:superoxide dismutase family protein [Kandeliimicrobium roseum]
MFRPVLAAALLAAMPAVAQQQMTGGTTANVSGPDGISGTVTLYDTASGEVLVSIDLAGVPAGSHGVHIHETGDCSSDDFKSAGGHLAGDKEHGVRSGNGPHPGDLPNATVGDDGTLTVDYFKTGLDMESVMDDDGSAFIVHSGADDYESQPAGNAGDRIACGVFEAN